MQTFPSHSLLGVFVGQVAVTSGLVEGQHPMLVLFIAFSGAIAPDMVMVPMFLWDKFEGRQPMTRQGPIIMVLKELSHSIPVWSILLGVSFLIPSGTIQTLAILFVLAGLLGGVIPDVPTHSEERFRETDCTFLFPFGPIAKMIIGTDTLRWPTTTWEYRIDFGVLWPLKKWERNLNYVVAVSTLLLVVL